MRQRKRRQRLQGQQEEEKLCLYGSSTGCWLWKIAATVLLVTTIMMLSLATTGSMVMDPIVDHPGNMKTIRGIPLVDEYYGNYTPSMIENYFLDRAPELGLDKADPPPLGCAAWKDESNPMASKLATFRAELADYYEQFQAFNGTAGGQDLRDLIAENGGDYSICDTLELHPQGLAGIFSSGSLSKSKHGGLLEPLFPPLRSVEYCFVEKLISSWSMRLDYLVHDFAAYCRQLRPHSRIVLVDMGAALDFHGQFASPAIYLTQNFERFGFHFDHIFAYEIAPKDPVDVFNRVPDNLLHAYHWMNVGVSAEKHSKLNPWNMVLKDFRKDDLVIVKLDIDTSSIENGLAQQLLNTPELHEIVDAFYFEHHVHLKELQWGWKRGWEGTVLDSLQLFQGLRKAGIDAHSWV